VKPEPLDIVDDTGVKYLHCSQCSKCVSTGFIPVPTDTPDKGIIVRAWIECPECIERHRFEPGE
jgi:hypothetical protein